MQKQRTSHNLAFIVLMLCCLLLLTFPSTHREAHGHPASTAGAPTPEPSTVERNMNPYVKVLSDPSGDLQLADVLQRQDSGEFRRHDSDRAPSFSYTDSAVWLKFHLEEPAADDDWILEVGYPLLNMIDLYSPDASGEYSNRRTGNAEPFGNREIAHRNFAFRLPAEWDEEQPFFLRAESNSALILPLTLWEADHFKSYAGRDYLILGLYYGITIIVTLYTLFLFLWTGRGDFLYYGTFIGAMGLFLFTYNGLSFQYLWPHHPEWGQASINFFLFASCATGFLYTARTLPVQEHSPALHRLLLAATLFAGAMLPLTLLVHFTTMMQLAIATIMAGLLIVLPSTVLCWRRGYRPARYVLCGWTLFSVGISLMALRSLGAAGHSVLTMYGAQFGFSAKIIFLFVGLADRMHILWQQRSHLDQQRRTLEMEKRALGYVEKLNEMLHDISISEDIPAIVRRVLTSLRQMLPYDRAVFFAIRGSNYIPVVTEDAGSPATDGAGGRLTEEDIFSRALSADRPIIVDDNATFPQTFSPHPDSDSTIIIPITPQSGDSALVVAERRETPAYSPEDEKLAANFAAQAALAMENAHLFHRVKTLAITDELTGLHNRRHFFARGAEETERAQRHDLPLSLIVMDIDNFKSVNDSYGHTAGDEILRQVGQRCREILRTSDVACRYGGEEFAFLLPETGLQEAERVAERLREGVSCDPAEMDDGDRVWIAASFGVAALREGMKGFTKLVEEADAALYAAKRQGKDRVIRH